MVNANLTDCRTSSDREIVFRAGSGCRNVHADPYRQLGYRLHSFVRKLELLESVSETELFSERIRHADGTITFFLRIEQVFA